MPMNLSKLKSYAPAARRAFIQAVSDRAALLGITKKKQDADIQLGTDVVIINGKPWPIVVHQQREKLLEEIAEHSFDTVIEQVAYSWFNRFVALRYMELHGYLDHGYQILGNPNDPSGEDNLEPEILTEIQHVDENDLMGLNHDLAVNLKLENKSEELYRHVLIAQCNQLYKAMPFLFEKVNDHTDLLLPDHLLRPDSIMRKLVTSIPLDNWEQVEIIGWLYQFYISERKDQVIGKTVKTEDIPAATQLFTPNWIVQYLVQNALGRQWLDANPQSQLAQQMPYYIKPAQQTPEVQAQLNALIPDQLDPESLTLIDPACGSGHILVEAYNLLKAIYLERGYRPREIPEKILRNNLFGLEIDPRAAQLASFALLMKAREDDPRLFSRGDALTGGGTWLNIRCIVSSNGLDAQAVFEALTGDEADESTLGTDGEFGFMEEEKSPLFTEARKEKTQSSGKDYGFTPDDLRILISLFKDDAAQTFGSLIRIPKGIAPKLPLIAERADQVRFSGDIHRAPLAEKFFAIAEQALLLSRQYDAVVANPPYMGSKGQNSELKKFAKNNYKDSKSDLYAMFIQRGFEFSKLNTGHIALVTMQSWMFLPSYENLRIKVLNDFLLNTMSHLGARAFSSISGEVVSVTAFDVINCQIRDFQGVYFKHVDGDEDSKCALLKSKSNMYAFCQSDFNNIPHSPVAFWVSPELQNVFINAQLLDEFATPKVGLQTGDNNRFLRFWHEVSLDLIEFKCDSIVNSKIVNKKWFPYNKGGAYRRWYGNHEYVVDWGDGGREINEFRPRSVIRNPQYYFNESISWSDVTSGPPAFRIYPTGFIHDVKGMSAYSNGIVSNEIILGFCNTPIVDFISKILNPTLSFQVGNFSSLPFWKDKFDKHEQGVVDRVRRLIHISRRDWESKETSWNFSAIDLLVIPKIVSGQLSKKFLEVSKFYTENVEETRCLEEENNKLFIDLYQMEGDLSWRVSSEQISLFANSKYVAIHDNDSDAEPLNLNKKTSCTKLEQLAVKELFSYCMGCMMGRYSLDEPGLIYAHSGNVDFDLNRYQKFPADPDGIVPITDIDWFDDDAANRLFEFIETVWSKETLEENLAWLADSLDPKQSESPRDTLRHYMADINKGFYSHHLSLYKKRPIYWMLSSGKHGAFQALIYLHRYHAGTLGRVRSEYVLPLMGKLNNAIEQLAKADEDGKLTGKQKKELKRYRDQLPELQAFDDKLHHLADKRIELDLDDGVKVNYGKFSTPDGDILARVKDVVGKDKGD